MASARAYRMTAQVGPGHRIELVAPELLEGDQIEVILLSSSSPNVPATNAFATIESLNLPPRDLAYWEAREKELKAGRDSWDR